MGSSEKPNILYPVYLEQAINIDRYNLATMSSGQKTIFHFAEKLYTLLHSKEMSDNSLKVLSVSPASIDDVSIATPIMLSYEALRDETPNFDIDSFDKISTEEIVSAASGLFRYGRSPYMSWQFISNPHYVIPGIICSHRHASGQMKQFEEHDDIYNV